MELAGSPACLFYPDILFVLVAEHSNYCKTKQQTQIKGCALNRKVLVNQVGRKNLFDSGRDEKRIFRTQ